MTRVQANSLVTAAETTLQAAAYRPVLDMPALLSHALMNLEQIQQMARNCPAEERAVLLARLESFQARLRQFNAVLGRSAAIFRGYCRHAGASAEEYTTGGISTLSRDPAFFTLSV